MRRPRPGPVGALLGGTLPLVAAATTAVLVAGSGQHRLGGATLAFTGSSAAIMVGTWALVRFLSRHEAAPPAQPVQPRVLRVTLFHVANAAVAAVLVVGVSFVFLDDGLARVGVSSLAVMMVVTTWQMVRRYQRTGLLRLRRGR